MSEDSFTDVTPAGWLERKLGQHIEIIMGQAPPGASCNKDGVGTPFVKVGEFGASRPLIREWTTKPLRMAREDDVLLCVVGATCGKVNRGANCAIGRSVAALRPLITLNSEFLFQFMYFKTMEMRASSRGSAQGVISKNDLSETLLPIPPIKEQEKIVEILEEQLSRLDAALASVRAVREKAAQFRRSLLHAAFTGALSGHDASMGPLPKGWEESTMGEIGRYLNGFAFNSKTWSRVGRPIIRIQNLTGSGSDYNYFDGEIDDRYVVREGDLLFSWAATLGVYIWRGPEAVLNQHIFKVESNVDKSFHRALIEHKTAEMMQQTHGTGMVHITKKKFDAIPILKPPAKEQEKIVEILDEQLSRLDAALALANATESKVTALRRSLLHAAFTGDLTKKWREGTHV